MPTRNSKRNSRATQTAPGAEKTDRIGNGAKEFSSQQPVDEFRRIDDAPSLKNPTTTHTNPNSGEQQVVPQPAPGSEGQRPAPVLEPAKSQEACYESDDDARTEDDPNAVGSEEGDGDGQQKQQEDEDAATAIAAAAALTAAAAEAGAGAGGQISEEDDEDDDPSVPKPRTGSEIGAEPMDSIIEDFREGAVRQRNKRKAAHAARATASEQNNSGATITSGGDGGNGDTNGNKYPGKRSKQDTGANSRHKRNLEDNTAAAAAAAKKKKRDTFSDKNKKYDQPSNGGGSGEGSNEPSGSQMAAMGGAAMDNGSDESGEECKSAEQPLPVKQKDDGCDSGEEEEEDRTEDESPRKRRRRDLVKVKEENKDGGGQQQQQGNHNHQKKTSATQEPWLLMPPSAVNRGQKKHHAIGAGRQQQQQPGNAAPVAPADLHKCASSLSSMHSFYTNAQHRFMAQMQEIMAVAMDHHTHAAVAALTRRAAPDILPAEDVTAISRACATALGIINNIGAAPGPAAAAAAFLTAGGGGGGGNVGGATASAEIMPPPPVATTGAALGAITKSEDPSAAALLQTQLLESNLTTTLPLPLPLSMYLPFPGAATAPPHPLQRQLSSGMDFALLHATAAINAGGGTNTNHGLGSANPGDLQNVLGGMVPVVGGAGMLDPATAILQMTPFPLQFQMAAAAAAAAGMPVLQAQPASAGN